MLQWCLNDKGTMHEMTKKDNRASMNGYVYHALSIFCFKNYIVMLRKCWLCNNHELTSVNENLRRNFLVHVYPYNFCLFRSVKFYCRGKWDKNLMILGINEAKMASFNY